MLDLKIVPQYDIDKIEEARKKIYNLVDDGIIPVDIISGITQPMWELTHRKYENFNGGENE